MRHLAYLPMMELIQYLKANDFKVYIVSGSNQDFIRAYSEKTYAILVEQIIGSAWKTHYINSNNSPRLIKGDCRVRFAPSQ